MRTMTRTEAKTLADKAIALRRMELQARAQDACISRKDGTIAHPKSPLAVKLAYRIAEERERIEAQLRVFGLRVRYPA